MYTWNTKGLIRSSISVVQWVSYYQRNTFTLKLRTHVKTPKYQRFGTDAENTSGNLTARWLWGLMFKFLIWKLISPEPYLYWANRNHASNKDSLLRLFTFSGYTVLRHTIIWLVAVLSTWTLNYLCCDLCKWNHVDRSWPWKTINCSDYMNVTLVSWDDPSIG